MTPCAAALTACLCVSAALLISRCCSLYVFCSSARRIRYSTSTASIMSTDILLYSCGEERKTIREETDKDFHQWGTMNCLHHFTGSSFLCLQLYFLLGSRVLGRSMWDCFSMASNRICLLASRRQSRPSNVRPGVDVKRVLDYFYVILIYIFLHFLVNTLTLALVDLPPSLSGPFG